MNPTAVKEAIKMLPDGSAATCSTASATDELSNPIAKSTLSASNH